MSGNNYVERHIYDEIAHVITTFVIDLKCGEPKTDSLMITCVDKFHTDGFYAARIWSQLLQVSTIIGLVITIIAIRKEKQPKEI